MSSPSAAEVALRRLAHGAQVLGAFRSGRYGGRISEAHQDQV